jgi:hypothetical protein
MRMAKPRKQKLKVFRTPIGFHDAYVAAPSQKAALEAWGADTNLFARGEAEQVDDPELIKEPLQRPGEVIKRLRGSAAEQVKELGRAAARQERRRPTPAPSPGSSPGQALKGREAKSPKPPKPSREELDEAEEALEAAEKRQRTEMREIEREIQALERRRSELLRRHERERDELAQERDRARSSYERTVRTWKRM